MLVLPMLYLSYKFSFFISVETAKWEKITYAGIAACTTLAFYNLSKGHPHHEEPPVSYNFSQFIIFLPLLNILVALFIVLSCVANSFLFGFLLYAGIPIFAHTQ